MDWTQWLKTPIPCGLAWKAAFGAQFYRLELTHPLPFGYTKGKQRFLPAALSWKKGKDVLDGATKIHCSSHFSSGAMQKAFMSSLLFGGWVGWSDTPHLGFCHLSVLACSCANLAESWKKKWIEWQHKLGQETQFCSPKWVFQTVCDPTASWFVRKFRIHKASKAKL